MPNEGLRANNFKYISKKKSKSQNLILSKNFLIENCAIFGIIRDTVFIQTGNSFYDSILQIKQ